ncbi:unnamed protein product [Owenia fusiformis]|uniref:B box-type domain-containing protein n=1 Tax=Owenia fusiformis TaxID=6347 RepID=A0A8S4Q2G4_OWEFU|nr:unnamed protein product [Owenia fusiformis]
MGQAPSEILDVFKCSSQGEESRKCENCNSDPKPAIKQCANCEMRFCRRCRRAHDLLKENRSHSWLDLSHSECTNPDELSVVNPAFIPEPDDTILMAQDEMRSCATHRDKLLEYYCVDDATPICEACCNTDHSSHGRVTMKEKSDDVKNLTIELNILGENRIEKCDVIIEKFKQSIEKFNKEKESIENEMCQIEKICKSNDRVKVIELIPEILEKEKEWSDNSDINDGFGLPEGVVINESQTENDLNDIDNTSLASSAYDESIYANVPQKVSQVSKVPALPPKKTDTAPSRPPKRSKQEVRDSQVTSAVMETALEKRKPAKPDMQISGISEANEDDQNQEREDTATLSGPLRPLNAADQNQESYDYITVDLEADFKEPKPLN